MEERKVVLGAAKPASICCAYYSGRTFYEEKFIYSLRHCPVAGDGILRPNCHAVSPGARSFRSGDNHYRGHFSGPEHPAGGPLGCPCRSDWLPQNHDFLLRAVFYLQDCLLAGKRVCRLFAGTDHAQHCFGRFFRCGFQYPLFILPRTGQPEGFWHL